MVVALTLLAACAERDVGGGGESRSGVRGMVVLGPTCPVESKESPCPDTPYRADVDILDQNGNVIATVQSGGDGTFEIELDPGRYTLQGRSVEGRLPTAKPVDVVVPEKGFVDVTVAFDTGIR